MINTNVDNMTILASRLNVGVIKYTIREITKRKTILGFDKHKSQGQVIRRRDTEKEKKFGAIKVELSFWQDVLTTKQMIPLMRIEKFRITRGELISLYEKYTKTIQFKLTFDEDKKQIIKKTRKILDKK